MSGRGAQPRHDTVALPSIALTTCIILAITSRQSSIDSLTHVCQRPPNIISPDSLGTSTGDSHLQYWNMKQGNKYHCLWIDLPPLRTPQGNRQDRRVQERIVCWAQTALRKGCAVIIRGSRGPQWELGPIKTLHEQPQWTLSRHHWCKFGPKIHAYTVIMSHVPIQDSRCVCP